MKKVFNEFTLNFDVVGIQGYKFDHDPDENCDTLSNYAVNDEWSNTATNECFKCMNNSQGHAIWKTITSSVSDKNKEFYFTNTTVIVMDHFMGKIPSVTILNEMEEEIMADIMQISVNRCVVTFNQELTGKVILN